MRSGVEVWLEDSRIEELKKGLRTLTSNKFIEIDDRMINTADITGIFTPEDMQDLTRRKNGEWKCDKGHWHQRSEQCLGHKIKQWDKRGFYK